MNNEEAKFVKSLGIEEDKIKQVHAVQFENYNRGFPTFYDFMQALLDFSDNPKIQKNQERLQREKIFGKGQMSKMSPRRQVCFVHAVRSFSLLRSLSVQKRWRNASSVTWILRKKLKIT